MIAIACVYLDALCFLRRLSSSQLRRRHLPDGPGDHGERQVSIFSTKKRPTAVKEKRMSFNVAHGYCVRRTVEVRSILGDLWAFSLLADDSLRIPVNVVAHGGVIARC